MKAKKVLEKNAIWDDSYYSKHLDEVIDTEFDLVVSVCDHAHEACPIDKIHVSFEDPDGKEYDAFIDTYKEIEDILLKKVKDALSK